MIVKNARFWVFINGADVKLTLRPQEAFTWSKAQDTDEGWRRETICWEFDGRFVQETVDTAEKDCDGRLDHYGEYECHVEKLRDGTIVDGKNFPVWTELRNRQRDYAAEAAGY